MKCNHYSVISLFCELEPHSGEVYLIQHYVIKLVSDLKQVGGFPQVSSTNKTDRQDIT
jgi:hypothetical protein